MPFELNFKRHTQEKDLTITTKILKLETFFDELQRSWEMAKLSIEKVKEIKKNFDKKRQNPQDMTQKKYKNTKNETKIYNS